MGGSHSNTRRVTVDLDVDDPNTVKISSDVLLRLRGEPAPLPLPKLPRAPATPPRAPTTTPEVSRFRATSDQDEVDRLERIFKQKIENLETLNEQLHKTSKENFSQAVHEVESKFLNQTFAPVCQDKQDRVLDCYKANPGQPLLCSNIVKDFMDCVNQTRRKVLSKKG